MEEILNIRICVLNDKERNETGLERRQTYREGSFLPDSAQHLHSRRHGKGPRLTTPATGSTSTTGSAEIQRDIWELMKPQMS